MNKNQVSMKRLLWRNITSTFWIPALRLTQHKALGASVKFPLNLSSGTLMFRWVCPLLMDRQERQQKKDFLSLLLVKNHQPKLIFMPKRQVSGRQILLPLQNLPFGFRDPRVEWIRLCSPHLEH